MVHTICYIIQNVFSLYYSIFDIQYVASCKVCIVLCLVLKTQCADVLYLHPGPEEQYEQHNTHICRLPHIS